MSTCNFVSTPNVQTHEEFIHDVIKYVIQEAVFKGTDRNNAVILWKEPAALNQLIDLKLADEGSKQNELFDMIKNIIKYSTKVGHPYFMNQLYSSIDPYGLLGQWITDALNPSVYTYEVSPVFTIMEQEVIKEMLKLVGFNEGDGMFCPGGSLANGTALNLARFFHSPDIKYSGICSLPRLVIFTSEEAHYSIHKMSSFIGVGESNVVLINTDIIGRMCTHDLEYKIRREIYNGGQPFVVVATAGTTVRGAIDPLKSIADICFRYRIWFHIDAAWGGGLIFSKKGKQKLDGISLADSVVINPHKLLAVPQQCSILLTKHSDLLYDCHSKKAEYLFQKDKFYDSSYDVGDKYLQCGRRCDVFKFWLMWKAKGTKGFGNHVDQLLDVSNYLKTKINESTEFKLVSKPDFLNVCFWYIPPSFNNEKYKAYKLHKAASIIKEKMIKKGSLMIGYQPLKQWPNFFRFVCQNSALNYSDIDYVLNEIKELGKDL